MATEVFINIKELPEVTELTFGDYVLIETVNGTHILDYKNLVLPESNTLVTNRVGLLENSLSSFQATFNTGYNKIVTDNTSISSNFDALSSKISTNSLLYYGKATIIINANNTEGSNNLYPAPNDSILDLISENDIIIFPRNAYAAKYPAYVSNIDKSTGIITINGTFYKNKIVVPALTDLTIDTSASFPLLCSYNPTSYAETLKVNTSKLEQVLNSLTLTTENSVAEEQAIYSVVVIKTNG